MQGVFSRSGLWQRPQKISTTGSDGENYRRTRADAHKWTGDSPSFFDDDDESEVDQAGQVHEAGNQPVGVFEQDQYPQPALDQVDQLQNCAAIKCIDHGVGSYPVKVLAGILGGLAVALFLSGVGTLPVIALALTAGLVFLVSTAVSAAGKEADESLL